MGSLYNLLSRRCKWVLSEDVCRLVDAPVLIIVDQVDGYLAFMTKGCRVELEVVKHLGRRLRLIGSLIDLVDLIGYYEDGGLISLCFNGLFS